MLNTSYKKCMWHFINESNNGNDLTLSHTTQSYKNFNINTPVRWSNLKCLLLAAFLSIVMLFTLTSCETGVPKLSKNKPVNIVIWHHYLGEQKVSFDNLVEEFNNTVGAGSGITVKAYSMDNTGDIHTKLLSAANHEPGSTEFPQMATAYPSTAYTLYKLDKLVPLEKYMSEKELDEYIPSFIDEGKLTSDSGTMIFPIAKSTEIMYINYTFFKQFLDEYNSSNPPTKLTEEMLYTFEGIQQIAAAYYDWTDSKTPEIPNDGKALYGCDAASNFAIITYKQLGDDFFIVNSDNTGDIDLHSPAMRTCWDSYYAPMVKGYYGAYSFYRSEDVQTGDLLMYTGSTAGASFFPNTVTYSDNTKHDVELKSLPYPSFSNGKKVTVQQGAGVILAKSTPEKEYASVLFLKWLTEPERNIDFVLKTGYFPVSIKAQEMLENMLSEDELSGLNENIVKVIETTLKMMQTHEFYTYKPFEASDEIRYSFEDKLLSFTTISRNEFLESLAESNDFSACVDKYITDQRYDQFLTEVRHEVLKAK